METMCKEDLKKLIQSTNFVVIELGLYLDTHPQDACALAKYHEKVRLLKEAVLRYEKEFGPLTIYGVKCDKNWTWVEEPWPWQKGCDC